MRRPAFWGLALALLLFPLTARANDYLTQDTDNWYRYESTDGQWEIESKIEAVEGNWRLWSEFGGLGQAWVYTSPNHDWFWIWNGSNGELVGNLSGSIGSYRYVQLPPCNKSWVRVASRGSITTPAGTFSDVTELQFDATCSDGGATRVWFARDVGIVRWKEKSSSGSITFELTRALVDGANLPGSPSATSGTSGSTSGSSSPVAPAEHADLEAILWGTNDTYLVTDTYRDALRGLNGTGVKSQIVVPSNYVAGQVRYEMQAAKVSLADVSFLTAPLDSIWIRDYGPIVLKDGSGRRSVADLDYYYNRRRDDKIPAAYASYRGWNRVRMPISYEGGNFATDGKGTAFTSEGVLWFNQDLSRSQIVDQFRKLGCNRVEFFKPLIDEGTTHIDMFARVMDDTHALVSRYPSWHRQASVTDAAARKFRNEGYTVVRVDAAHDYDEYATYSNSVLANGVALVPQYGDASRDKAALDAYRALGYQAHGVDSRLIIKYSGATHCVSMQIPTGN